MKPPRGKYTLLFSSLFYQKLSMSANAVCGGFLPETHGTEQAEAEDGGDFFEE